MPDGLTRRARDVVWLALLVLAGGVAWGTVRAETSSLEDRMDRMEVRITDRLRSLERELRWSDPPPPDNFNGGSP